MARCAPSHPHRDRPRPDDARAHPTDVTSLPPSQDQNAMTSRRKFLQQTATAGLAGAALTAFPPSIAARSRFPPSMNRGRSTT
jgi:hypothetical protein